MAIKWKNKKKGKVIFGISVILVLTIVNLLYFPAIGSRASERSSQEMLKQQQVNMGLLQSLYEGALVLYYEQTANTSETVMELMDLFVKKEELSNEQCAVLEESFYQIYGEMERDFRGLHSQRCSIKLFMFYPFLPPWASCFWEPIGNA